MGAHDYEWITFDCYGTLIDWDQGVSNAFEKVARASDLTFDRRYVLTLFRKYEALEEITYKKYHDVLNRVARRVCVELGYRIGEYNFIVESLPRWRPFQDTIPGLLHLARNHKLGILSNVDNDLLAETRKYLPVPFDLIVTAENVSAYKPAHNHFQEARRKLGNARWIHVAQSHFHDITPCSRLGIDCAWINRNNEVPKDPKVTPLFNGPDLFAFVNWLEGAKDLSQSR